MPVSPTASAPGAVQARHQLVIHAAGENLQHRVHGLRRGHPQAVHEAALDAALRQIARHLLAAAMHHHQLDAAARDRRDLRRQRVARRRRDRAASRRA